MVLRPTRRRSGPFNWKAWRDHGRFSLSFRMTQVLVGYEVLEGYLQKIGKEVANTCHHCGEDEDTVQHTLRFCPACEAPRRILRLAIGESLDPPSVVKAMLRG